VTQAVQLFVIFHPNITCYCQTSATPSKSETARLSGINNQSVSFGTILLSHRQG